MRSILRYIFGEAKPPKPEYAFCETVHASALSPWHIRKLTEQGKKLGGGADTPSLCGLKVSWDLRTDWHISEALSDIERYRLTHVVCKERAKKYKEIS